MTLTTPLLFEPTRVQVLTRTTFRQNTVFWCHCKIKQTCIVWSHLLQNLSAKSCFACYDVLHSFLVPCDRDLDSDYCSGNNMRLVLLWCCWLGAHIRGLLDAANGKWPHCDLTGLSVCLLHGNPRWYYCHVWLITWGIDTVFGLLAVVVVFFTIVFEPRGCCAVSECWNVLLNFLFLEKTLKVQLRHYITERKLNGQVLLHGWTRQHHAPQECGDVLWHNKPILFSPGLTIKRPRREEEESKALRWRVRQVGLEMTVSSAGICERVQTQQPEAGADGSSVVLIWAPKHFY